MSQDDVTQIRVGNSPVGIMGLKTVMKDMAEEYGDRPDREIRRHGNPGPADQRRGQVGGQSPAEE